MCEKKTVKNKSPLVFFYPQTPLQPLATLRIVNMRTKIKFTQTTENCGIDNTGLYRNT